MTYMQYKRLFRLGLFQPKTYLLLEGAASGWQATLWRQGEVLAQGGAGADWWQSGELQELGAAVSVRPEALVLLLPSEAVVQLLVQVPAGSEEELEKALAWEMTNYLPGRLADYAYSYQVVEKAGENQR